MRTQHIAQAILLGTIVLVLTGCQVFSPVGDFISQRYTNTASYFNTYYNAQKMFSDAENEVLQGIESGRQKSAKGQTVTYVISSTARQKFTASIEKNSKLLSYYPTSKFVDDALLMIGKAYFYLDDDVKAERKFLELIAQFPKSSLIPETKLWLGKSLLRQNKIDEGIKQLQVLYTESKDNGDDDVAGSAALALGTYSFEQKDYQTALQYYAQSLEESSDGVENARTQFQIGLCYDKLGNYPSAADAFRRVGRFKPDYNTTFQAAIYESKMLTVEKKYDAALAILFDKLDDAKYTEFAGTAHREVGNTYAAQGNITEAVAQFRFVDTAYARTDDAARSMFALASLYEKKLLRYDSARVYYDKARVEYSASDITPDATLKSETFAKYFSLKHDLGIYDTLITDLRTPGWRKKDSLTLFREDSVRRVDSIAAIQKAKSLSLSGIRKAPPVADTAQKNTAAATKPALRDTSSLEARSQRMPVRTEAEIRDSIARADSTARIMKALAAQQKIDSLSRLVIRSKFELAGLLYLDMNRPDSALVYFNDVVRSTSDSLLAARAYFTMADLYRTTDSTSHAVSDSLYRTIIAIAPTSSYADESRKILGMAPRTEGRDSSEVDYLAAEQLMLDGKTEPAITAFRSIPEKFPKSAFAPKALYTIGYLYEYTIVDNDSAAAVFQRLVNAYPTSIYANGLPAKLNEIALERRAQAAQEERERQEKAAKEKAEKEKAEKEKQRPNELPKPGTAVPDSAGSKMPPDSLRNPMPVGGPGRPIDRSRDTTRTTMPVDTSGVRPKMNPPSPAMKDTTKF